MAGVLRAHGGCGPAPVGDQRRPTGTLFAVLLLELLDLDRLTRGLRQPERSHVDLRAVAEQVIADDAYRDEPIHLVGTCPDAEVDAAMVHSIVGDLVGNAVKHTPATTPGNGLGLALVASFTRLHGGELRIEEREGGGARFVVDLPGFDAGLPSARDPSVGAPAGSTPSA